MKRSEFLAYMLAAPVAANAAPNPNAARFNIDVECRGTEMYEVLKRLKGVQGLISVTFYTDPSGSRHFGVYILHPDQFSEFDSLGPRSTPRSHHLPPLENK